MDDSIIRQVAIDAILSIGHKAELSDGDAVIRVSVVNYVLRNLPSAQPEIIYCGDCKYASPNGVYGCRLERFSAHDESVRLFAGDYCSAAERRTDERQT